MRYRLDDLMKQAYREQEAPSPEFCRTVILEMKKREVEAPFWKKKGMSYKVVLAVACVGIIFLAGFGIQICRQERLRNSGVSVKQDIAVKENQVPIETEHPVDREDKVETEKQVDRGEEEETDWAQDVPQENGKGRDENGSSSRDREAVPGQQTMPEHNGGEVKEAAETEKTFSGRFQSRSRTSESGSSAQSEKNDAGPGRQDSGAGHQGPQAIETAVPGIMPEASPPPEIILPQGNYVSLCSVESFSFLSGECIPGSQPDISEPAGLWGSVIQGKMIQSYEQLQVLIGEIQEKLDREPDAHLQEILLYLKGYQPNDFVLDALCMDVIKKDAGLQLKLNNVFLDGAGEGKKCLNIQFDWMPGQMNSTDGSQYYVSMVRVSQKIAKQCGRVRFWYS